MADLEPKTDQYERMLAEAIDLANVASVDGLDGDPGAECLEMAQAYLDDGRHFRATDDPVNALAAYSYAYGWLDAGARIGVLDVPRDDERFTVA
ncbi:DUF357 domain-containing protein [Halococcoides cellulosivorans]